MMINLYNKQLHLPMILSWFKQWNISKDVAECLPDKGLMCYLPKEDIHVCAAFLYTTNSTLAFAESLICNRSISKELRQEGIDLIIPAIFEYADKLGYKKVISYIQNKNVLAKVSQMEKIKISDENYRLMVRS